MDMPTQIFMAHPQIERGSTILRIVNSTGCGDTKCYGSINLGTYTAFSGGIVCEGTQCYDNLSVRLPFDGTILTKKEEKTSMVQPTTSPPNRTGFHTIQDSITTEPVVGAPSATDLDSTDI
ncbi:hypothetical protein B0H14DRAFT_2591266 [Mycena olivaceomarginata]|nr:hypothetical protein B0H14DRAFT_2591266 [Mycena olivaceomarginata]